MKRYTKGTIIAAAVAIVVFILFMWGYWMVLGQKFKENPLFYYTPRTIENSKP